MQWLVNCSVSTRGADIRCAQLSFTTVNWASIESLLGGAESRKVLDHSRHILALHSLDVVITDFAGEESIFGEGFFDLSSRLLASLRWVY